MAGEWREYEWGQIATLEYGKSLRDYRSESGRYPAYGTNGPIGWHDKPLCTHPGVIIERKGAYRGIHYSHEPFFVIDTAFYLEPKQEMDLRWAYYCLLTYDINGMDSGSAIPSTSREAFYRLPVAAPPLLEQRAIAHILGTLDDKIELNRRMNRTLEKMARATFKSWFVDFDPVIDNALAAGNPIPEEFRDRAAQRAEAAQSAASQGRPFGLPKPLAAQFPNAFHDSELGPIPQGWEVGSLGCIASNPRRSVRHEKIPEKTSYIALEHMPRGSIALNEWGSADGVASNKYAFQQGEILFGKLRPYFHKVGVAPVAGVCSTDILVVVPRQPSYAGYVLSIVSSIEFIEYTTATSGGTRMPRTNWKDMAAYPIPLPSSGLVSTFNTWTEGIVKRIHTNIYQSKSLAALRDTLLPKLLSGELRVNNAEKFVEAGV